MPDTPSPEVIERIVAGHVDILVRCDIFEQDTTTPWLLDAPIIDGSVSIDWTRDERRTATTTLVNEDGIFNSRPIGFWYDKVIKLWRGIPGRSNEILDHLEMPIRDHNNEPILDTFGSTSEWMVQLGEFYVDDIDQSRMPRVTGLNLRDATVKLMRAKFVQSTEFPSGVSVESVVHAIAVNGGIPASKLVKLPSYGPNPPSGVNTTRKHLYDRTTERWRAIKEIAEVNGFSVYFDHEGFLVMEAFSDPANPAVSPSTWTFETGGRNARNSGFEVINPVNGEPDWWYTVVTGTPEFAIEEDGHQRSGSRAIRITTPTGADGGGYYSEIIPVEPGWVFEVSAWSKANKVADGKYIRAMFRPAAGDPWASNAVVVANANFTTEYTQDIGEVTVPDGMSFMDIRLDNWTGTAKTAWFDDVFVQRVYPAEDTKGNLVTYQKKAISARIYNHVVVTGESANTLPVWAEAENNEPTSPTRISELGRRTYFYTSAFITSEAQALAVAQRLLAVRALESFEVNIEAIVTPWLEPGRIVTFLDPEGAPTDPVRYLLSDLTIPLRPGVMTANVKRVTIVG